LLEKFGFGFHLASLRKDTVISIGMQMITPEGICFIGEPDICIVDDRSIVPIGWELHALQVDEIKGLCWRNLGYS